jgi:hypothetical protein
LNIPVFVGLHDHVNQDKQESSFRQLQD